MLGWERTMAGEMPMPFTKWTGIKLAVTKRSYPQGRGSYPQLLDSYPQFWASSLHQRDSCTAAP